MFPTGSDSLRSPDGDVVVSFGLSNRSDVTTLSLNLAGDDSGGVVGVARAAALSPRCR